MSERMRMKLGKSRVLTERLDDLEHTVVAHALLARAGLRLESHHKQRVAWPSSAPFCRQVLGEDGACHLGKGQGRLVTALALHATQAKVRHEVADVETHNF